MGDAFWNVEPKGDESAYYILYIMMHLASMIDRRPKNGDAKNMTGEDDKPMELRIREFDQDNQQLIRPLIENATDDKGGE